MFKVGDRVFLCQAALRSRGLSSYHLFEVGTITAFQNEYASVRVRWDSDSTGSYLPYTLVKYC